MDHFNHLANILKPETQFKRPFTILRKVVKLLQQIEKSEDITEVINLTNKIFFEYQDHQKNIFLKVKMKDFSDVNGLDFNIWAYDTELLIQKAYYIAKDKYHSLHFDKYGYNAY